MEFVTAQRGQRFEVTADDIDPSVFGLNSYSDPVSRAARVTRHTAIQVPAVKRARDLIAGTLGTLPLDLYDANHNQVPSPLLDQPEPDIARSVTITRTVEDMLFEGRAWWRILARDYRGYPTSIRRLNPNSVQIRANRKVYVKRDGTYQGDAWEWVPDRDLIRFDSPNPGLLSAGARAIRTCLKLDAAVDRASDGVPPIDYFTPTEGADPADDTEIATVLDEWQTARQTRSTAYVPAALTYNTAGWTPDKLQLADQRASARLEIALAAGIDPEEVGVSVTSRTYFNAFDRKQNFTQSTLGGYRQAFEDRLKMRDCTPTGFYVAFDLAGFLKSDDLTRMQVHQLAQQIGVETPEESREAEGRPPLDQPATPPSLTVVPNTGASNG